MSVRDKASQAHQRGGDNYIKLTSDIYMRCKAKDGKGHFELMVGDEKKITHSPLKGYLVGQAMILSAYDEKTGDSAFSAPYYTNKKISLFIRSGKKVHFICNGTKQQCEDKLFEMRFGGKFKTRKVYYVAAFTSKGDPKIFCIETNLPMAIELQKKINPSSWADYLFEFQPTLFDRSMDLSDNCREALKPLFLPNNQHMEMGYTNIVQSDPLTDEFEIAMKAGGVDLEAVLDNFNAWKKEQGVTEPEATANQTQQYYQESTMNTPIVYTPVIDSTPPDTSNWDSDLPF